MLGFLGATGCGMSRDADDNDVNAIRANLLNPAKGFHVCRGFYSPEEVAVYRDVCRQFLEHGRVIYKRINSDSMPDYVHPRSHDRHNRTYRIYQFLHNHRADMMGRFFSKATSLRDRIEEPWNTDPIYQAERERLQSYCVVTYYRESMGMLPRHQDYKGPAKLPLIQFWVALSEPGVDYRKGNLVLFPKTGVRVRAETDLALKVGDALIFDKALFHEVEAIEPGEESSLGRCTVLIGARAARLPFWQAQVKGLCYDARVHSQLSRLARMARRFGLGARLDHSLRRMLEPDQERARAR